jgi:hypothetical protein
MRDMDSLRRRPELILVVQVNVVQVFSGVFATQPEWRSVSSLSSLTLSGDLLTIGMYACLNHWSKTSFTSVLWVEIHVLS